MINSIVIDIFSIVPLIFTIWLAKRHILQDKKNGDYIIASLITILLLLLEIASLLLSVSNNTHMALFNYLINCIGFSLSPVVPYIFFLFNSYNEKSNLSKKLLAIPIGVNFLISILSYRTGWIFSIDALSQYSRGTLFFIPTLVSMFYYYLVLHEIFENKARIDNSDKRFLISIFLLPLIATPVQIFNPSLLLIWPSVALCLLLYYIFSIELHTAFDVQTHVKNRAAFEKEMNRNNTTGKGATIFVFDLNNLKRVNDAHGHHEGDKIIRDAANAIKLCFVDFGNIYRIGGDEFSVICPLLSNQLAETTLSALNHLLIKENQTRAIAIELAYGYSQFTPNDDNIYTAFSRADNAMYAHKTTLKESKK